MIQILLLSGLSWKNLTDIKFFHYAQAGCQNWKYRMAVSLYNHIQLSIISVAVEIYSIILYDLTRG